MRRIYEKISLTLLSLFMVFLFSLNVQASEQKKRVFIVHSYEKNHICGQPQHDGAVNALEESGWVDGKNMTVKTYYMDTKRKNNTPELIKEQGEIALAKVNDFTPDILITLDDNAFKTVALPLTNTPVNIVFSGMNNQPEKYNEITYYLKNRGEPGHNITGVYEKLHVKEAIRVLSNMLELKKIRILSDLSPTGKAIARQVELEIESSYDKNALPCLVDRRVMTTWEEFTREIEAINRDPEIGALYLGALLLKDASGKPYTAPDIIDYTIKHSQKPAMGLNYAFIKLGLFGGASVDFFAMGHQAGVMASEILQGGDPGNMPIQDAHNVALVFNLKRLKSLGIEIPQDILLAADEVFHK